ncbi:copper homeostasis periplasmic binding protein CopC [Rhizobium tubonense]|uniref:Cu resistance protein n=1 Tax=Rhizobium tubonense TaxID=484088 RepID=A0A2W4CRF5_9HYPH|nr:copper homeostasis periplasmic binding protein CopC [Rhizobium tubonense]PZM15257.1 Cu resistance protein [Rhizobium tubonense]
MFKTLVKLGMAAVVVTGLSSQAFAHAHLKSSTPADKSTVTAPTELDLAFTEELNLKFTGVKVTGPKKGVVKTGDAMLMDGNVGLMVPLPEKLEPGAYTVEWHALSADGHKTTGAYSFTVKP